MRRASLTALVLLVAICDPVEARKVEAQKTAPPKGAPAMTSDKKSDYTKPPMEELQKKLTPLQFEVTQKEGTERPFANAYWDNKKPGIYVDVVTGEPLFSSLDKYDSGTGWPSFTKPIDKSAIDMKTDHKLGVARTEIRSKGGHLGHVFEDGPKEAGGMRYCTNSASLRFVALEDLEKEGYGEYRKLFDGKMKK